MAKAETEVQIKTVIGLAPGDGVADGIPVATVLIPELAYSQMKNGKITATFDLTKLGVPLRLVIGHCKTFESGMREMTEGLQARGIAVKRMSSSNLGIDDPKDKKAN